MPSWLVATGLGIIIAVLSYFLKKDRQSVEDRLKAVEHLHDKVLGLEHEVYGARGDNGHRQRIREMDAEQRYQGAHIHWIGNVVQATAEKGGIVIRADKPKRSDFR